MGRALEVQGRLGAVEVAVIPQPVALPHNPKTKFTTALLGKSTFSMHRMVVVGSYFKYFHFLPEIVHFWTSFNEISIVCEIYEKILFGQAQVFF